MSTSTRHRWGPPNRLERETWHLCFRCEMAMVAHHEHEGGQDIHWEEFYRDDERVPNEPGRRPPCDARRELRERAAAQMEGAS